jgi:thiol-disulfide isomerase/thioredoxin/outer membrane lipoprotein-sorting protein
MPWRSAVATMLLTCCALSTPAAAEIAAPEAEILRQVAETYRGLGAYMFEGSIHVVIAGTGKPQIQDAPFFVAVDTGGRLRDQVKNASQGGMIVSDGKWTVVYNASLRQYTRRMGSVESVMAKVPNRGIAGMLMSRYAAIEDGALSARRLPDESLTLNGAKRNCVVLEVAYPPSTKNPKIEELPRTYWIDAETHLVLRQHSPLKADIPEYGGKIEQKEDVTFERAMLNPVLPESTWVFRPPPGVRLVTQFTANVEEDNTNPFAGQKAFDFTLKDLKGEAHALKALRGKVVLLDFWATWCGPCRLTMPQVAKIHEEFKGRGVEVMSINVGETALKAGDYIKKNGYQFTTLLDHDREVADQYKVNGIPTLVVIDRAGTVTDYMVGARDDNALRAALQKAGVK